MSHTPLYKTGVDLSDLPTDMQEKILELSARIERESEELRRKLESRQEIPRIEWGLGEEENDNGKV